jgi:hypothetical protein
MSRMLTAPQRGGGGNVHKEKYGGHSHDPSKPSIIEKAKELITGHHKDKKTGGAAPSPTT